MDTFKAEYEFYNSNEYLTFAKRLKAYSKIPTLDEMDPYTIYPVQTIDGTSIFSATELMMIAHQNSIHQIIKLHLPGICFII